MGLIRHFDFANIRSRNPNGDPVNLSSTQSNAITIEPITISHNHRGGAFQCITNFLNIGSNETGESADNSFSVFMTVNWEGKLPTDQILWSNRFNASTSYDLFIPANTEHLAFRYDLSGGGQATFEFTDFFAIDEYNWVSVGLAVSSLNGYATAYKNGEYFSHGFDSGMALSTPNTLQFMFLGRDFNNAATFFNGHFQTAAIWNEELSADDLLLSHEAIQYRFREDELVVEVNGAQNIGLGDGTFRLESNRVGAQYKTDFGDGNVTVVQNGSSNSDYDLIHDYVDPFDGLLKIYGTLSSLSSANRIAFTSTALGFKFPLSQTKKFAGFKNLKRLTTEAANIELDVQHLTTSKTDWNQLIANAVIDQDITGVLNRCNQLTDFRILQRAPAGEGTIGTFDSFTNNVLTSLYFEGIKPSLSIPNGWPTMPDSLTTLILRGEISFNIQASDLAQNNSSIRFISITQLLSGNPVLSGDINDLGAPEANANILLLKGAGEVSNLSGNLIDYLESGQGDFQSLIFQGADTFTGDISAPDWSSYSEIGVLRLQINSLNTITGIVSASNPFVQCLDLTIEGSNTISGDIAFFVNCRKVRITGNNTINTYSPGAAWRSDITSLVIKGAPGSSNNLSVSDTNELLANLLSSGVTGAGFELDIFSLGVSGQGITDKATLEGNGADIQLNQNT